MARDHQPQSEPGARAELARETERLADLVDELLVEFARLREENRQLRGELGGSSRRRGKPMVAAMKRAEAARQDWERDRQAIADRIEAILGKFQWLESGRATRAAGPGEA